MNLNTNDYKKILKFYNISKPKSISYQHAAENILAQKLCTCIKKIQKKNKNMDEKNAIALCRKSIFTNRGIDFYNFKCKKQFKIIPKKNTKNTLKKKNKSIKFKSKLNKTKKNKS